MIRDDCVVEGIMVNNLRHFFKENQDSILTIFIFILGACTSIFFNIYLSRNIGPSSYGNFKVAEAFFYFGGIIAIMGGASAALKFLLSQLKSSQDNGA